MFLIKDQPKVLAIGSHPDDIELGAGGFIRRLTRSHGAEVHFLILTAGTSSRGPQAFVPSTRWAESYRAAGLLGVPEKNVKVLDFHDCSLHNFGHEMIAKIEDRLKSADYEMVLTHAGDDTHADHRAVYESTLSAVRDFHGVVLLYQAPSTKPNGFRPTFFVRLDEDSIVQKHQALMEHESQREKAFMQLTRTRTLAGTWSLFLRQPGEVYLEAFEIYKCFI